MSLKVLVVDDATFVRDMVKRTVRQLVPDVSLLEAPDGARAMGIIKSKKPDLILSDWEMPEMSGEDLLKWLRAQPATQATPFVMITSRGDRDHVVAAAKAGVSDYLSKPFTADELSRKISKQLKRIGYKPPSLSKQAQANRGVAFGSVDVLTGGKSTTVNTKASNSTSATAPKRGEAFKGRASLRFPNIQCPCHIQDLTLQALNGLIPRPEAIPAVFDQAVVDILTTDGEVKARLNAYVHAVSAAEPTSSADKLRIIVRFVDQDPEKLDELAKLLRED